MKIPKKRVKIGVHTYTIAWQRIILSEDKEVDGVCDHEKMEITLSDKLKETQLQETFIHECLHAIEETYKINLGESRINALAPALLAFLKDNKLILGAHNGQKSRNKRDKTGSKKRNGKT